MVANKNAHRILHIHKNVPGVLAAINNCLSDLNVNIVGQHLNTNPDIGYVVLDVDKPLITLRRNAVFAALYSTKIFPQIRALSNA